MMAEQASICFASEPLSQSFHCCECCAAAGSKLANMRAGTTIPLNTRIHVSLRMGEEYQSALEQANKCVHEFFGGRAGCENCTAKCPLLALSGHGLLHRTCPLSGAKPTCIKVNSVWLNEDVSAILDLIESAHAIHERFSWHPNPICIGGVDIQHEKRIRFGVVCTNPGNMRATPFAYRFAPESDAYVVTSTFEVIHQLGPNVLPGLAVVNYSELCGYPIGSQHFIELTDFIAVVADLFSINRQRLSEDLRPRLLSLRYYVVLCEARNGWIVV